MKLQSAVLAVAMAVGAVGSGCPASSETPSGSGGSSGSGGKPGSGGAVGSGGSSGTGGSSGGGGNSCPNVTACAGSVPGTWPVMSSCLTLSGNLDVGVASLDPTMCNNVKVSGSLQVTGSWTAKSDGTYTDDTTTTGDVKLTLPAGCLKLSGTTTTCDGLEGPLQGIGLDTITCTDASGGGCECSGTVNHKGGIGLVTGDPQKSGNYTISGNKLTADTAADYSYCVAGTKMTWTPSTKIFTTSGTIVFQSGSTSTGSGGMIASGGTTGSGGMIGSGGTTGSGGRGGGAGGRPGSGGISGSGTGGGGGTIAGSGGATGSGGTPGTLPEGPCDIYAAANTPCVAAYSMVRVLTKTYSGPLYQVRSGSSSMNTGSGGTFKDIGMTPDGFTDSATQDAFCMGTVCTVSLLYDQSGKKNNLKVAPKGRTDGGQYAAMDDFESSATKGMLMVGGHKVYSLYMAAREGYRLTAKGAGMPLGTAAEGIYMLADGTHSGSACCWDFGNVSTSPTEYGVMNTLFLGIGSWGKGGGNGPWFMGDFEGGVWAAGSNATAAAGNPHNENPSMKVNYALGILHTSPGKYALRMADTNTASDLTTAYDGNAPKTWANDGGILLGIGGDNSNNSWGTFYEGAITAGAPTNATDLAVMKNIKAVGYGK